LHHTPSPGQIFADVAKGLKPGGILLVCDLSAHDQDWVREACGDQWLGFEPSDLAAWASDNALSTSHNSFFALRNGFQIQIHQFTKPLITKPLNNS
jgi:2-polyprenyl-3-methyl-5-hydroxy-6-metoxy-1,4-benzoquinol methylase